MFAERQLQFHCYAKLITMKTDIKHCCYVDVLYDIP
jgi:hypothetical protein